MNLIFDGFMNKNFSILIIIINFPQIKNFVFATLDGDARCPITGVVQLVRLIQIRRNL